MPALARHVPAAGHRLVESSPVADTLAAGAGLCDPDAVCSIVADGYRAVSELVGDGARLESSLPGSWDVTREGGHSRR
ncbi:FAD-binding protein, partial [Mycobacterium sp. 1081908.1]|uniref:FAD-binding protein n=1 Tax=Mycobacterium sp. 1081908.1 TaxID=1834066 RepID=UPI00350EE2E3